MSLSMVFGTPTTAHLSWHYSYKCGLQPPLGPPNSLKSFSLPCHFCRYRIMLKLLACGLVEFGVCSWLELPWNALEVCEGFKSLLSQQGFKIWSRRLSLSIIWQQVIWNTWHKLQLKTLGPYKHQRRQVRPTVRTSTNVDARDIVSTCYS